MVENGYQLKEIIRYCVKYIFLSALFILSKIKSTYNILLIIMRYFTLAGIVACVITDAIKITKSREKKQTSLDELNRKSLYDDEIAEYHLKTVLQGLSEQGIKVVFIFDELDKIEEQSEIEHVIGDLKPLLLSDLANFIIIAGQKLYYNFINANMLDDSIMSSIFSKDIHIPLTSNESMEKFFVDCLVNPQDVNDETVKEYLDSLILNSNRTIRRFINLIVENIVWEDKKAYVYIEDIDVYKTDSIILDRLTQVIEEDIENLKYEPGIKDFLMYQLYIWIKKMKRKNKVAFTMSDIFDFETDYSGSYPNWCKYELIQIYNRLIENLLKVNLLKEVNDTNQENKFYQWTNNASIKDERGDNNLDQGKIEFLDTMINLERYCREICLDLKLVSNERISLGRLIKKLVAEGVLESNQWNSERMVKIHEVNNKIRHGIELNIEEENTIRSVGIRVQIIPQLVEAYCYYVVNGYMQQNGYKVTRCPEVDFVAKRNNGEIGGNILFEVKCIRMLIRREAIENLIKRLEEYNHRTGLKNKLIILWFSMDEDRRRREPFSILKNMLSSEYQHLNNDVHIFHINQGNTNFDSERLKEYLDEVTGIALQSEEVI